DWHKPRGCGQPRSGRRGREFGQARDGRSWRLGAGPWDSGTAQRRSSALDLRLRLTLSLEHFELLAKLGNFILQLAKPRPDRIHILAAWRSVGHETRAV